MKVLKSKKNFWNIETIKSVKVDFSPVSEKKYKQSAEIKGNSITFLGESSVVNQQTFVFVATKKVGINPLHAIYPLLRNVHNEYIVSKLDSETSPIPAAFQVTLCILLTNDLGQEIVKDVTGYFKYNVFYQSQEFPYGDFIEFCVSLVNSNLNSELTKLNIKNRYARIDISWAGWSPTFLITRSKNAKYSLRMRRTKDYSLPLLTWSSRARIIRMLTGFKPLFVFNDTQNILHYYYEPQGIEKEEVKQEIYDEFLRVLKGFSSDIYNVEDVYVAILKFYKQFPDFLLPENITNLTNYITENILNTVDKQYFEEGMQFLYALKKFLIEARETPLSRIVENTFQKTVNKHLDKLEGWLKNDIPNLRKSKPVLIEKYFRETTETPEAFETKVSFTPRITLLEKPVKQEGIILEEVVIVRD